LELVLKNGVVSDHAPVAKRVARGLEELIPDGATRRSVVDLLATDLNLHAVDEGVADMVDPARLKSTPAVCPYTDRRQVALLRYMRLDETLIARDRAGDLQVHSTVEGLLDGLRAGKLGDDGTQP
jgi:hypothetical protein